MNLSYSPIYGQDDYYPYDQEDELYDIARRQNDEENQNKPLRILRTITEVPTHWGSKLASWKRLKN